MSRQSCSAYTKEGEGRKLLSLFTPKGEYMIELPIPMWILFLIGVLSGAGITMLIMSNINKQNQIKQIKRIVEWHGKKGKKG